MPLPNWSASERGIDYATTPNPFSYPLHGVHSQSLENRKHKTLSAGVVLPMYGRRLERETNGNSLLLFLCAFMLAATAVVLLMLIKDMLE